jgi:2-keto-4-pentenoate hydratase/2-oxohepta-3-ene-1,7-dioic acid hydratase in catechol pathway
MKLVSFEHAKRTRFGIIADDGGIIDLTDKLGADVTSLRQAIAGNALDAIRKFTKQAKSDLAIDQVKLLPPIPEPGKIICIGAAYRNAKHKDGSQPLPRYPSIFLRIPRSFVGHRDNLIAPPESVQLDYEGEIGIVIGKAGRRIAEQDAESHIAGLTVMNEGTVRDWLKHGNYGAPGKNFDASGACGPWMVTADERCNPSGRHDGQSDFPISARDQLHIAVDHAGAGRPDRQRHTGWNRHQPSAAGLACGGRCR